MTPHDIDRAYADYDLYRRALARCITSGSHFDADDAPPCSGCLLVTAKRLAIPPAHVSALASASPSEGARLLAEGADGAAGPRALPASPGPAAPSSKNNRPPARNEGPAEGAAATARTEGTR